MSARYDDWFGWDPDPDGEPPTLPELIFVIVLLILILFLWR